MSELNVPLWRLGHLPSRPQYVAKLATVQWPVQGADATSRINLGKSIKQFSYETKGPLRETVARLYSTKREIRDPICPIWDMLAPTPTLAVFRTPRNAATYAGLFVTRETRWKRFNFAACTRAREMRAAYALCGETCKVVCSSVS